MVRTMVVEVRMPKLGLTMTKGTIKKWLKNEGEAVKKGEPLLVIETEKITSTIEAPATGHLIKVVAQVGTTVPVGGVIAYIGEPGEPIPTAPEAPTVAPTAPPAAPQVAAAVPEKPAIPTRVRATPRARALAEKEGVDLTQVRGSGPGGLITEEDVLKHVKEVKMRTKTGLKVREVIPMTALRATIAERMVESLRVMAQVTIMREEDVSKLVKLRDELQQEVEKSTGVRLTYTPMLIKIVAEVLKENPLLNSTLEDNEIKVIEDINIGFAVAVDHGLLVPVVKAVDKKNLKEVVIECSNLAQKAREGKLTLDDVGGGTFTITNLGMYGVDGFTPIINPPQVAILGVGRIVNKPVVVGDRIEVRPICTFSLTFDHRVVDGHTAAQFLNSLVRLINDEVRLKEVLRID